MLFTVCFLHDFYLSWSYNFFLNSVWNFKYTHYNSGPEFTVAIWIPLCYVQPHQLPVWAISPGAFGLFLSAQLPLLPGAQSPSVISLPSALWQLSFPFLLNLILLVDPVYLFWELLRRGEWYMGFETLSECLLPPLSNHLAEFERVD